MKHKLKKIIVLFLLTGILFVSCELQEDYHSKKEYEGKMKISHKNFSELLNDRKFNKAYGEVLDKKNKMSRTVMEEQYQFTIANGLANIIETDSDITYTLLIKRDSKEENTIENLVVKIDSLNETTAYIVKFKGKLGAIPSYNNLNDDTIEKVVTPIIYNSNIASKEIYECYKVSYWVCYYPGHTETGVCTHGQYETMEFCEVVGYDIGGDDVISVGGADGGGGGGGSSSTGSDYDGSDGSIHGNGGATELDMAPILDNPETDVDFDLQSHIEYLNTLTSKSKIKTRINAFIGMINTSTTEQGSEFLTNNASSDGFDENIVQPNHLFFDGTKFLPTSINSLVWLHLHHNTSNSSGGKLQTVFSYADIERTIENFMIKEQLGATDSDNITSLLVSRRGVYALRITNPSKLESFYNELHNQTINHNGEVMSASKYLSLMYLENVINLTKKQCNGCNDDTEEAIFELNFKNYLKRLDCGLSLFLSFPDQTGTYSWMLIN